jgi:ABC-type branched-subunit amino acid transport system permease subunit
VARAFHALRDSENTAISMGIDPVRYKLLAFGLSGFIAGVAGGCWGYMNLKVVPGAFTFQGSLQFITYTVIAGIALQAGAVAAPIFFVLIPTITATTATGVNNVPFFILPGFLAIRTVIDYPNGFGGFLLRVLRPFDRSEQVAWASAEAEGSEKQVIDLRDEETEESLFEEAAHTGLVGAPGA